MEDKRNKDEIIAEDIKNNIIKIIGKENYVKGQNMINNVFQSCEMELDKLNKSVINMIKIHKNTDIQINEEFLLSLMKILLILLSFSKSILRSDYYNQDVTKIFRNKTTTRLVYIMSRIQMITKDEGDKILKEEII